MKEKVLICCLARDCATSIVHNIPKIEKLRKHFSYSEVLVVENDSKDNSKEVLLKWEKECKNVNLISFNNFTVTYPDKTEENLFPGTSLHRITKMAFYRNMYLKWLSEKENQFDLLIILDIDVKWFSIDGVLQSINEAPEGWGAIFSNGYTDTKIFNKAVHYMYHDVYAFLDYVPTGKPFSTTKAMFENKKLLSRKLFKNNFLPVISAFSGIGVYKIEAIVGLKYKAELNHDKYIEAVCEHIPLNLEIVKRGYTNYISSKMKVYYGSSDIKMVIRNILSLRLFKILVLMTTFKRLKE